MSKKALIKCLREKVLCLISPYREISKSCPGHFYIYFTFELSHSFCQRSSLLIGWGRGKIVYQISEVLDFGGGVRSWGKIDHIKSGLALHLTHETRQCRTRYLI